MVGVMNKVFTDLIPQIYGKNHSFIPAVIGKAAPVVQESKIAAIWAVEGALLVGILTVLVFAWQDGDGRASPKAPRPPSAVPCWPP
jgi:hypothetical protein